MTDLHHLAAAYALDALEPDERARFEQHLDECADCTADVRDFRTTTHHLAEASAVTPPPHMRDELLARVAATPQEPAIVADRPPNRPRALPMLAAAVLVLVALGLGVVTQVAIDDRNQAEQLLAVMTATDATVVDLEPSGTEGTVRVVWSSSEAAAVVVGADLPAVEADQTYELWALSADGPKSAGQFSPGDDGRVERRLALPAEPADGWGVTVEPAGGSPQPTGDIIFLS